MRETRPRLGKAEAVRVVGWSGGRKRPATAGFGRSGPLGPEPGARSPEPGARSPEPVEHGLRNRRRAQPVEQLVTFERDPAPSSWSSWRRILSAAGRPTRRSAQEPTQRDRKHHFQKVKCSRRDLFSGERRSMDSESWTESPEPRTTHPELEPRFRFTELVW